jgi:hypothetical protein
MLSKFDPERDKQSFSGGNCRNMAVRQVDMKKGSKGSRMLAVVRCGDSSLHRSWCPGDFDVGISYFGDDKERSFDEAKFLHYYKGGKWDGIYDFFQTFPEAQENYDYFWFPDDDVRATASDVERLVAVGSELGLDLFQPALDADSYYSHLITLAHPSFRLRYTNFVEIMVPMLSARLFSLALPTMAGTKSGFGLDLLWPQQAAQFPDAGRNVAIVDEVTITHTRPVGGSLHQYMKKVGGNSSGEELSKAMGAVAGRQTSVINGVPTIRVQITGAQDPSGREVSALRVASDSALDLLYRNRNRADSVRVLKVFRHAAKAWMGVRG